MILEVVRMTKKLCATMGTQVWKLAEAANVHVRSTARFVRGHRS